jgi:hypothetical protein
MRLAVLADIHDNGDTLRTVLTVSHTAGLLTTS